MGQQLPTPIVLQTQHNKEHGQDACNNKMPLILIGSPSASNHSNTRFHSNSTTIHARPNRYWCVSPQPQSASRPNTTWTRCNKNSNLPPSLTGSHANSNSNTMWHAWSDRSWGSKFQPQSASRPCTAWSYGNNKYKCYSTTACQRSTACQHNNAVCTYHQAIATNPILHNKYATFPDMLSI